MSIVSHWLQKLQNTKHKYAYDVAVASVTICIKFYIFEVIAFCLQMPHVMKLNGLCPKHHFHGTAWIKRL